MTSSTNPTRIPGRVPEPAEGQTTPRPAWPRPEKKTPRFPIRLLGNIPA